MRITVENMHEFFELITLLGIGMLALIYSITCFMQWIRRKRRSKTHLRCRICGFQFIALQQQAHCPHCKARNR